MEIKNKLNEIPEEEMTVNLELDDGRNVTCEIVTILEIAGKDYIALLPRVDEEDDIFGEVWFYGYKENPDDVNEEPELTYIDEDDVYEAVADAFDEWLDTQEFDEIIEE